MRGWTIDKAKVPNKKPHTLVETFRAHRQGRHATCRPYWSSICAICWRLETDPRFRNR